MLVALLAYWPGLSGALIFDDLANLEPLRLWLADEVSWQHVLFGNESGPLGRPLSMASFLANVSITGDSVWWLKFGNLALHLITGGVLFAFFSALAPRDPQLRQYAYWVPGVLAALWLLHPFMVGTVQYVVQRMAILSALFMIATILAYLHGRTRIEQGRTASGMLWLFLGVPILTALAALSKENGLLAPLLCGVLEWAYFAPRTGASRPRQVQLFLAAFIAAPLLAALTLLILNPEFYFAGYANRPFGPIERVLTQSRILFDYLGNIVLPNANDFSLFKDNYKVSTGVFSPPTTGLAIVAWLMTSRFSHQGTPCRSRVQRRGRNLRGRPPDGIHDISTASLFRAQKLSSRNRRHLVRSRSNRLAVSSRCLGDGQLQANPRRRADPAFRGPHRCDLRKEYRVAICRKTGIAIIAKLRRLAPRQDGTRQDRFSQTGSRCLGCPNACAPLDNA